MHFYSYPLSELRPAPTATKGDFTYSNKINIFQRGSSLILTLMNPKLKWGLGMAQKMNFIYFQEGLMF